MTVVVDIHEPDILPGLLKKNGVPVEVKRLQVGDYLIGNTCLERKTVKDFLTSIMDRNNPDRFGLQLRGLVENYEIGERALLLEGVPPTINVLGGSKEWLEYERRRYKTYWSALLRVALGWKIPPLKTASEKETAFVITELYRQLHAPRPYVRKIKKARLSLRERKEDILTVVPLLGRKQASILLDTYNTILNIINAPREELYSLKGVRKQAIDNLFEHFTK